MADWKKCIGYKCPIKFIPNRPDQAFHSKACQARNSKLKNGSRREYDPPPAIFLNPFVELMRRFQPKDALGYRLYCAELEMFLPAYNSLRRDGRRPKHDFFELLEIPLVPFPSSYAIHWLKPGKLVEPENPIQYISIGWADNMRQHGEVGRRLAEWRRNKRLAKATAQELPPDEEGDADDEADST